MTYVESCRKKAREYIIRGLSYGNCNSQTKESVGNILMATYEEIYSGSKSNVSEEEFDSLDSAFLFFMDLICTYILELEVMEREENAQRHIEMLSEMNEDLCKMFVELYRIFVSNKKIKK